MKFKLNPLIAVAACLVLYSIYYILSGKGGNLVGLAVIYFLFLALTSVLLSYFLRKIFRESVNTRIVVELIIIAAGAFIFYQRNGHTMLQVPRNFHGYIYMVYGVDGAPELKRQSLLSADFTADVPASGIILTSSTSSKSIGIFDSATGKSTSGKNGPGFPIKGETLQCAGRSYHASVIAFKNYAEGWSFENDSTRIALRKELACKSLQINK